MALAKLAVLRLLSFFGMPISCGFLDGSLSVGDELRQVHGLGHESSRSHRNLHGDSVERRPGYPPQWESRFAKARGIVKPDGQAQEARARMLESRKLGTHRDGTATAM